MTANPCGYVFVEAEAGLGKTAFAAWLVKTRGYLSHFSRYADGGSVAAALGNLSAQLIMQFGLDDQAPGGMLPEWYRTPGGFESLLAAAARKRQGPVVLVADGIDEADAPAGSLPFGLPLLLPDGVFVIATYRTGHSPRWPDTPAAVLRIARNDPRNRRDIGEYLANEATEKVLAALMAETGSDPAEFAGLLGERCGGVWVYLRYVLHELRIGLRRPDEISGLPAGLRNYYANQVRRWQQDPAWHAVTLPLLATLAATGEALPAASLARLAGDLDPAIVQRTCNLTLRPLLSATRASPLQYEIYHASFRELLSGSPGEGPNLPDDRQPYELLALADELGQATAAAHIRICDSYLGRFGGIDPGLPVLAADPDAAGTDGGYPLRHLVRHLRHAGRTADLHALLAAEHAASGDQAVNTWFAAHDRADSIVTYLADIALARSEAAAGTDRDLSSGRLAPALGMEIRYALIAASITSTTDMIPIRLLEQLLNAGIWSARRGLDHAHRIADPKDRLDALLVVCRQTDAEKQPAVRAQAMAAVTAITNDYYRACALAQLAPHLPEAERPAVLAQALTATATIKDGRPEYALKLLAPHLPADLLAQALTAATAITSDYRRANALAALAPYLPADLLAQALAAATAITNDDFRAEALIGLAPHLPEAEQAAMLARALTATATDHSRALILTSLAPHLPEAERPAALAQALAAAIAAAVPSDPHSSSDAEALTGLAPYLPADLLAQALTAATAITDKGSRAKALAGVAPHMPEAERPAALAQALAAAADRIGFGPRQDALALLAPHLPADLLAQAVAAFTAAASDGFDLLTLAELAPYLPADLLAQAMAAATAITNDHYRACSLAMLAPHLPEAERPAVLALALAAATAITDDSRAYALAALALNLPEAERPAVLAQALTAATAITNPYSFTQALAGLAPYLPADLRAQALAAATAFSDSYARAGILAGLAPHLPAELLALTAVATADDYDRAEALVMLAPYLPADLLAEALTAATAIDDDFRGRALAGLAPYLPADLLAEALTAATAITNEYSCAEALAGLAPHLPEAERPAAALVQALAIVTINRRAPLPTRLASWLPAAERSAVLAKALAVVTCTYLFDFLRAPLLTGLASCLPEPERSAVLAQALAAATADDESREYALAGLAPHLPADLLAQALVAVTAITNDYSRTEALAVLAPHLPADLLAQALGSAPRTDLQGLIALLKRGHVLYGHGKRPAYVRLLRDCLNGINREAFLEIVLSAAPAITEISGAMAIEHYARAVTDVHRWWP